MPLPPADSALAKPIQPLAGRELTEAFRRLLARESTVRDGLAGLSPEQQAEAFRRMFSLLIRHVENIGWKLDVLYAAVQELEQEQPRSGRSRRG